MKEINGGVVAAQGFYANGINAGIRKKNGKRDLSLIYTEKRAVAASMYTSNKVKSAPIYVTKENISDGYASCVICNSGNANTCNADGIEIAKKTCELVANELKISPKDVIVASTGVIGMRMSIEPFENGIKELVKGLSQDSTASAIAAEGIMTTDTRLKECAVEFVIDGKTCHLGAITKGAGMIMPNMATMLCFVTTDVAISKDMLDKALHKATSLSFNMLSVDGDTSTNDMVSVLANGLAENKLIDSENADYKIFEEALIYVTKTLAKKMAKDGEGATKLIVVSVHNAKTEKDAKIVAKSCVCSSLLKAAMFGADANWGRVLCAIGYSAADVDVNKVEVQFKSTKGSILVCQNGAGVDFSEEKAKEILLEDEIEIFIDLHDGKGEAEAFGCDLTYEYVKINGDYRS